MSEGVAPRDAPVLLVLGGLSLVAVLAGVVVCALSGVPAAVWGRNLAAWVIGGGLAVLMRRTDSRLHLVVLATATGLLALTLLGPGQLGVHRWVAAGPASFNVAMLMLPAVLASLAWLGKRSIWWWGVPLALMAILVAQPDRSQATAFGAGVSWLALRSRIPLPVLVGACVAIALLAIGAWFRPDPLAPVPEVEGIVKLAYSLSPAFAAIAFVSLVLFSLAPAALTRTGPPAGRWSGEALSVYFLICAAMPFLGAYPVPLVGMGMSPILGAWLAAGVLAAGAKGSRASAGPDGAAPRFS